LSLRHCAIATLRHCLTTYIIISGSVWFVKCFFKIKKNFSYLFLNGLNICVSASGFTAYFLEAAERPLKKSYKGNGNAAHSEQPSERP